MGLAEIPLVLMLVGLAAYAVLGGADFGAGFWSLFAGRGDRGREVREHAHDAMGPVWEANHVWLIFVLVVCWTAYPTAFASIVSTLSIPLFVAAVGIIMRGTAYALRSGTTAPRELGMIDAVFGVSSILTPFALGAAVGGIASGRVPVGNAAGDLVTSWLNATSILIGTIAVATAAYLAAVYLAADAVRLRRAGLEQTFRLRALGAGVLAGAIALAGLFVLRDDAERIWDGLTSGAGLVAVLVSVAAGSATLALVWLRRYEPARYTAAVAVAAVVAGWPLAQRPFFLPGLTIEEAAAGRSTLVATLVVLAIGAVVLIPSLGLLFGLVLRGRFDTETRTADALPGRGPSRRSALLPAACLLVGAVFMIPFDSGWAHVIGVTALLGFVASGLVVVATPADEQPAESRLR